MKKQEFIMQAAEALLKMSRNNFGFAEIAEKLGNQFMLGKSFKPRSWHDMAANLYDRLERDGKANEDFIRIAYAEEALEQINSLPNLQTA